MKLISLSVLVCLATACSEKEPGKLLAQGMGRGLVVSPAGSAVAFLLDARHPDDRAVPDDLYAGDLWLAVLGEGAPAPRKVGSGVSSGEAAYAFSPGGGALAFLSAWRFRSGAGELWLVSGARAPRKLADEALAFAWSKKGDKLAWVAGGRLFVLDPAQAEPRAVADAVQSFAWAPDALHLAARGPASAGSKLWLVDATGAAKRQVAEKVSDFAFAADGALGLLGAPGPKGGDRPLSVLEPGAAAPRELGRATSFAFAPSGTALLALSTQKAPGEATGELARIDRLNGQPQPLGAKASDYRFSPAGDVLFLARYDVRSRAGTLSVAPAGGGPVREIAQRVQGFSLAPAGDRVFYLLQRPSRGDFKLELWTAELKAGAAAPRKIDDGVYGYDPSPDGAQLYWKARCSTGPRSCSLFRMPLASGAPEELAKNVAGFDLSRDGARLLLAAPHRGSSRNVDLSWLPASAAALAEAHPIAVDVEPSARFLDPAGLRAAFAVLLPGKPAVYLAELK